jgi:hypothetical protein
MLAGIKGLPTHDRSLDTITRLLASSCIAPKIANLEALQDQDDDRELFAAAWCAHPDLVPDEMVLAILELEQEHDGGPPLFLCPWEIIHDEVPALRYWVKIRLVEYQDWHTPPPSSNDEDPDRDDSDDSGDSNFNGYHPGEDAGSGGGRRRPWTSCFGNAGDPALRPGLGPACRPCGSRQTVTVGHVICPLVEPRAPMPCRLFSGRKHAVAGSQTAEATATPRQTSTSLWEHHDKTATTPTTSQVDFEGLGLRDSPPP